jgi:hypothetical protein
MRPAAAFTARTMASRCARTGGIEQITVQAGRTAPLAIKHGRHDAAGAEDKLVDRDGDARPAVQRAPLAQLGRVPQALAALTLWMYARCSPGRMRQGAFLDMGGRN